LRIDLTAKDTFRALCFEILICLLLAAAIFIVYWQVIDFDFAFDDFLYVTDNHTIIRGITFTGIRWAFSTFYAANWHPLTWISHMLDVQLFGMNPGMHHLSNVIFHILNTFLLFFVLQKMTGALWRSAAVATLFALHPLHVESVAWISERKDVLSTFFWLLTMVGYYWYVQNRSFKRYLLVVFIFILGLLSKPMLVTLPFALLLLDFWPLNQLGGDVQIECIGSNQSRDKVGFSSRWRQLQLLIREKTPLIILAIISSGVTYYAQKNGGTVTSLEHLHFSTRLTNSVISYTGYLGKMLLPIHLAVLYPYPDSVHLIEIIISLLIILFITFTTLLFAKQLPYLLVGWFWYLGTLIPVIGIVQVGLQSMADRYTYIPLVGIFIMIVWGLADLLAHWQYRQLATGMFTPPLLIFLMWTSWVQVSYWKNSETLFTHTLELTKNNYLAHNNLGIALFHLGDVQAAIGQYQDSLKINPHYEPAHFNLGRALAEERRLDEALDQFMECIKTNPQDGAIYNSLGNIMLVKGNVDKAIKYYTKALQIDSHQERAYYNLGNIYFRKGNIKKAIGYFINAIHEKPGYVEAIDALKNAITAQKNIEDLILRIKETIKSEPNNTILIIKLGDIYRQQDNYDEAIAEYRKALSIKTNFIEAMYRLVLVYSDCNEFTKALNMLQNIRLIQPGNPEVYYNIACIYAKQNMRDKSIECLKQSIEKGFHNWELIKRDPDLANIRNTAFINELMNNH
jgi:protein O-mannosyl-transferase